MINKINDWIAIKCTIMASNMWTAYLFLIISLVSLPAAIASHDAFTIVSWISQSFLQLILLPIIMVGQNLLSKSSEQRAIEDHDSIIEILNEVKILLNEETQEEKNIILLKNQVNELCKNSITSSTTN